MSPNRWPKWKYILIYGPILGFSTFAGSTIWNNWIDHQPTSVNHLIMKLVIYLLMGLIWGYWMWAWTARHGWASEP